MQKTVKGSRAKSPNRLTNKNATTQSEPKKYNPQTNVSILGLEPLNHRLKDKHLLLESKNAHGYTEKLSNFVTNSFVSIKYS